MNEKYKGGSNKYKTRTKVVQYLSVMQTYRRNTGTAVLALNLAT